MGDRSLQNLDWLILLSTVLLMGIGLLNLYSVGHVPSELSETFEGGDMRFFQRQAVWAGLGLGIMALAYFIPFRYYEGGAVIFYVTVLIMLVVVVIAELCLLGLPLLMLLDLLLPSVMVGESRGHLEPPSVHHQHPHDENAENRRCDACGYEPKDQQDAEDGTQSDGRKE